MEPMTYIFEQINVDEPLPHCRFVFKVCNAEGQVFDESWDELSDDFAHMRVIDKITSLREENYCEVLS